MIGTKVWLNRNGPANADGLVWVWRFPDEDYGLRAANGTWELSRAKEEGRGHGGRSTGGLGHLSHCPPERRRLPSGDVRLEGTQSEIRRFTKAFKAKLAAR